jgi:hypothetical protein
MKARSTPRRAGSATALVVLIFSVCQIAFPSDSSDAFRLLDLPSPAPADNTAVYPPVHQSYSMPAGYFAPPSYAQSAPEFVPPGAGPQPYSAPNQQQYTGPTIIREQIPAPVEQHFIESTWYTRVDYFHWNERAFGADVVNENGPLVTLGYQRRFDCERFRAELFGESVNYSGGVQDDNGNVEPLDSITNYVGVRAEYDLVLQPETLENVSFFVGIGTRIWNRDLPAAVTPSGMLVAPTQEDWFTFYPYIGIERRRDKHCGLEWFWMARIGCTALTLERSTDNNDAIYPKAGVTAQLEGGVRGKHLFASAFSEVMRWRQSSFASEFPFWYQPTSTMVTVGLRTGCNF